MHPVPSSGHEWLPVGLLIVTLTHTEIVIVKCATVQHEFESTVGETGAALRAISDYGEL